MIGKLIISTSYSAMDNLFDLPPEIQVKITKNFTLDEAFRCAQFLYLKYRERAFSTIWIMGGHFIKTLGFNPLSYYPLFDLRKGMEALYRKFLADCVEVAWRLDPVMFRSTIEDFFEGYDDIERMIHARPRYRSMSRRSKYGKRSNYHYKTSHRERMIYEWARNRSPKSPSDKFWEDAEFYHNSERIHNQGLANVVKFTPETNHAISQAMIDLLLWDHFPVDCIVPFLTTVPPDKDYRKSIIALPENYDFFRLHTCYSLMVGKPSHLRAKMIGKVTEAYTKTLVNKSPTTLDTHLRKLALYSPNARQNFRVFRDITHRRRCRLDNDIPLVCRVLGVSHESVEHAIASSFLDKEFGKVGMTVYEYISFIEHAATLKKDKVVIKLVEEPIRIIDKGAEIHFKISDLNLYVSRDVVSRLIQHLKKTVGKYCYDCCMHAMKVNR